MQIAHSTSAPSASVPGGGARNGATTVCLPKPATRASPRERRASRMGASSGRGSELVLIREGPDGGERLTALGESTGLGEDDGLGLESADARPVRS